MTTALFNFKPPTWGETQGKWDLTNQTSFFIWASPFSPDAIKEKFRVLSFGCVEPVTIPEHYSKYFLNNVFPLLRNDDS